MPPGIILAGQQATLQVFPTPFSSCEVPPPTSVVAEVEGPSGELLPSQITLGPPDWPAILEFTPVQPGRHHILAAFSHSGGLHQFELQAALDRSAQSTIESLPTGCGSLERTLQGAWVCDSEVVRDGRSVGAFSGARLAVAGDVIWVVDGETVWRYLDNGSTLVLTGSFKHERGGPEFLLAAPSELTVLHPHELVPYTFQDGVVISGDAAPWARPNGPIGPEGPYGVLLREGDRLATVTRSPNGSEFNVEVCPYQLLSGQLQSTAGGCPRLPGEIIGFEPGVLWTKTPPTVNGGRPLPAFIYRWLWTDGQLVEQGVLPLAERIDFLAQPLRHTAAVPLVQDVSPGGPPPITAVVSWSPERKVLLLECLDAEIYHPWASPSFYWGPKLGDPLQGPTRIRIR